MHPIEEHRRAAGWTQHQLAERIGVNPNSVHSWEHGKGPRARYIPPLAEAFGVDALELLRAITAWGNRMNGTKAWKEQS